MSKIVDEASSKIPSPLDGIELMSALGHPPRPWIEDAKDYLSNLVMSGLLKSDDIAGARKLILLWDSHSSRDNLD